MAPRASGFDWATIGTLGSHRIHGFDRLFVLELNPSSKDGFDCWVERGLRFRS